MPIESSGYEGSVLEDSWAEMHRLTGTRYAAAGADDWRVEALPGGDRQVRVLPGRLFGCGILDVADTATVLASAPVVPSGSRWDSVVARRDWQANPGQDPGGETTIERLPGNGTQAPSASRQSQPGSLDDNVLALVRWTAGQTAPTGLIDMRSWASKVVTVTTLQAVTDPEPYQVVRLTDGREYRYELSGAPASWQWVQQNPDPKHFGWYWGSLAGYGSWDIPDGDFNLDNRAAGSARTVSCVAGHLYRISSLFTVVAKPAQFNVIWRGALFVDDFEVGEVYGTVSELVSNASGRAWAPTNLTQHWMCPVTGNYTVSTRFAANAVNAAGVYNPFRSPFTEVTDLGRYENISV